VTWNDRKTVHTGWVRLGGLLHDAGLSPMSDKKLAIKVEVDTRPPAGSRCERQLVTRHLSFLVQYYDLPSLMAGKLHALLTRRYAKGRDWYDLMWYLSQRPPVAPNLTLLQNALDQTPLDQTKGADGVDARRWMEKVRGRLLAIDVQALREESGVRQPASVPGKDLRIPGRATKLAHHLKCEKHWFPSAFQVRPERLELPTLGSEV